jgi:hypothetical protein
MKSSQVRLRRFFIPHRISEDQILRFTGGEHIQPESGGIQTLTLLWGWEDSGRGQIMKRNRPNSSGRTSGEAGMPMPNGTVIQDKQNSTHGEIIDHASQFTHPQAAPIFMYLVQWQDGQVSALSEAALKPMYGLTLGDSPS